MPDRTPLRESQTLRDLKLLEEIESNPQISQRELSHKLAVALGIVNSLIHSLVRKGFVKIQGKNNRTLTYHLTHRGVLHKSKLALEWTKNTVSFYLRARELVVGKLKVLSEEGIRRIVIYGTGELAEIALIVSNEANLEVLGLIDEQDSSPREILRLPVRGVREILEQRPDAVIICEQISDERMENLSWLSPDGTRFCRLI